jgi:hypothetical protein
MINLWEDKHWEYYTHALAVKDCKELVNKINATFFNDVLRTRKQGQNKSNKMQGKYSEEDETCNVSCAPPSSWSWYQHCHNISGGITKMNGAIGDID